jgi:AcrR family transcriptional regulator
MSGTLPVGATPLAPVAVQPAPRLLTGRQRQVVELALRLLATEGPAVLTMRRLAAELDLQAPSLYKHVANKAELELFMVESALIELGSASHAAVTDADGPGPVASLLTTYRRFAVSNPELYRLATGRSFSRAGLTPGLEDWAGEPFWRAVGDAHVAQALWGFAHGLTILEIDDRLSPADLDATWAAGAAAFSPESDGAGAAGATRTC